MILIVASELDAVAQEAARHWPGGPAIVLTPRDLCTRGWRIELGAFDQSQIVASGRVYPVKDITGVLTLMPYVMDYELFSIEESDRKYVASEVSAFLFYFLSALDCPVLNRPTAHCLVGPSWRLEQWSAMCLRAGVRPIRSPLDPQPTARDLTCISVLGNECVGDPEGVSASSALELARLAQVEFLTVRLEGDAPEQSLRSVGLVPDLRDGAILEAVHNYFRK